VKVVATPAALDLVAYLLSLSLDVKSAPAASGAPGTAANAGGAKLYAEQCAACHQPEGQGLAGVFPPLAGNSTVNAADATAHVASILRGVQGRTIDGVAYAAAMPPFAELLDDAAIAALVNHERQSWGNHGAAVTAAFVRQVRQSAP
jgi:cytochrome c oxidase cbb3-type subunit 2